MAQALKFGQTVLSMKASGDSTKLMETVNSGTLTEMSTKDYGRMTRQMVMASTCM